MKFLPTRDSKKPKGQELVANLDALVSEPLYFQLGGKVHKIEPISAMAFFKYANAMTKVEALMKSVDVTQEQVFEASFNLINSICTTVSQADIEKLEYSQIGALHQMVIQVVTGTIDEKKKTILKSNLSVKEVQ